LARMKDMNLPIYAYTDYRDFLRNEISVKRDRNAAFSIRAAAAQMNIGTGTLNRILNGSRNIGPALLPTVIAFLGLKPREAEYFSLLVRFSRTAHPGKKRSLYEQILRMRGESRSVIPEQKYGLFEQWECLALHQLLRIVPDCSDPAMLGALLAPKVSPSRVRKALDLLERNGMIRSNDRGGYSPVENSMTTGETWLGVAIHGFQKTSARMAMNALDSFQKAERDFSTLTISVSPESFKTARDILRKARQEILALDEKETRPERVYQMNLQLFPLSRMHAGGRGKP
jgi:uncharacterized protein (TIGR02147 family)